MRNPSKTGGLCVPAKTFSLAMAGEGERVRITAFSGGRGMMSKMTELGLPIGSEVTVTQRQAGGPLVVACNDTRVALGGGMAHRVMVALVEEGPA